MNSMPFLWIIFSYFLGSIPFGYLIGRLSGKNVLEVGWRKTSGSNVFKNVGKWQGVLTAILDVSKGYAAVYGARTLGLSSEVQVLSGVAAVTGHNWSLFLKFAGGRGIGTFAGAFLALSPQILLLAVIPLIILAVVWNTAIGTILFLFAAIFLSRYLNQFGTAGVFTTLSLVPIFIKRLSPIEEIKESQRKAQLLRNRLIFDDDVALLELRIKRIFQKTKGSHGLFMKIMKPVTAPFWLPPKVGWQVAKFGVKMAKKPIGKFILKPQEKVVNEIKTEDFKKMMVAAAKKIVVHQEEINKINVFPVADKDTGYNLAATLLGIEGTISQRNYQTLRELTKDIKEAAMINARGNAGMIYTGYLIEVLDRVKHLETIDAFHLALAMRRGIKAARSSIAEPVEGTILDTVKAAGERAYEVAKFKDPALGKQEKNIIKMLEEAQKSSDIALKETKEKLQVLKENDVVDAGALGFVKILEAWVESLKGVEVASPIFSPETEEKLKYRVEEDKSSSSPFAAARVYEVVLSFRKNKEISAEDLKNELSSLGDSLEILELEDKIKLHIHTNEPELVREKFRHLPEFESRVEELLYSSSPFAAARAIEDMEHSGLAGDESKDSSSPTRAQRRVEKNRMFFDSPRRALGLVVDEVADLPKEFLEKYNIEEVPFTTRFPDGEFITSKEDIYQKMKEALATGRHLPTTAAPSFKNFLSVYQNALKNFEKILVITISSKLSGAYSSARIARSVFKKPEKLDIFVFDCFTAEVGEGLAAIKTQELISQGKTTEEIVEKLKEFCPKITLLACIDDFKYVVRGGRVRLPKIFIGPTSFIQKLGIRFLVGLKNGKVKFFGASLGKDKARILAEEIDLQRRGGAIQVAIAHADNLKEAQKLKTELEKRPQIKVLYISSVSPVVATHTGPGALLAAFHPIDK